MNLSTYMQPKRLLWHAWALESVYKLSSSGLQASGFVSMWKYELDPGVIMSYHIAMFVLKFVLG